MFNIIKWLKSLLPVNTNAPLNLAVFNKKFTSGNEALKQGNTEGFKKGLTFFIESLPFAGQYSRRMRTIIKILYCALPENEKTDPQRPWNKNVSEYGITSWEKNKYNGNEATRRAWPYIKSINEELIDKGLGWRF